MRLIDADALIDEYCEDCFGRSCGCEGEYCLDIKHINKAPTVEDAVVVVRCKNCAHNVEFKGRTMCSINAKKHGDEWYGLRATNEEFFCANGERKSDNE